jgi:hypothetical protein
VCRIHRDGAWGFKSASYQSARFRRIGRTEGKLRQSVADEVSG